MSSSILIAVGGACVLLIAMHTLFYSKRKVLTMLTGLGISLHKLIAEQQKELGELRRENERLWRALELLAEGGADE